MRKDKRFFRNFMIIMSTLIALVICMLTTTKEHPAYMKVESYAVSDYLAEWTESNVVQAEPQGDTQEGEDTSNENTQNENTENEYIFQDSAERYLTDEDLEGLTLQQINYAKNEIYARLGRLFVSQELMAYFGAKSWYEGRISPKEFNEGMLNDYERANANKLSEKEYSMNSEGYQLY